MEVLPITGGVAGTNAYVVADEAARQCVLFDAPDHTVAPLLDAVRERGWDLLGLWLTHGHFDHIADHQLVRDAFPNATIRIHPFDEPKLQRPNTRFFQLPFVIPAGRADAPVNDGDVLRIGGLSCRVIHTPGHSPGHVCFYFERQNLLVGGDLVIGGAIGRYDLPDSNLDDLCESVRTVMRLPAATKLLPGHGSPSTLGDELASNPYVRQIVEHAPG